MENSNGKGRYRFGAFEIDINRSELRKDGLKLRLQDKPFQVLATLVLNSGQTVTREELRKKLWPADLNVDFDGNLNTALTKVRQALDDSAENSRMVETVPRQGYRFLPVVEELGEGEGYTAESGVSPGTSGAPFEPRPSNGGRAAGTITLVTWLKRLALAVPVAATVLALIYFSRDGSLRPAAAASKRPVLMVLPFANLSEDAGEDYLSDGLTDELITRVGSLNPAELGVIARTSTMHYKGTHETVRQIAREVGANYVLGGSMRRAQGRVRVTVELVQAASETSVWQQSYESTEQDILQMQGEVAKSVADALAVTLLPQEQPATAKANRGVNETAYEHCLQGRLYWSKRTPASLRMAEELYTHAVNEDPQLELGYAGLAETYVAETAWKLLSPQEGFPRARAAAQKALELNDSLGRAHGALAIVDWQSDHNWAQAETEFRRAIALDPANATARQWYADFLCSQGRHAEAATQIESAREIDPLSMSVMAEAGNLLYNARHYEQAIESSLSAAKTDGAFPPAYLFLSRSYLAAGKTSEAVEADLKYMELSGVGEEQRASLRQAFRSGGVQAVWRWKLDEMKNQEGRQYVSSFDKAVLEARRGNLDAAFADLELAYTARDTGLVWIKVDPGLDPLRKDPRFKNLLERMHLES